MPQKKIVAVLISAEGEHVSDKQARFFADTSPEYQLDAINLWAWRSELSEGELLSEPIRLTADGVFSKQQVSSHVKGIVALGVTGVVCCALEILVRVGLGRDFIAELRKNNLEVWTSESVSPLQEEELQLV